MLKMRTVRVRYIVQSCWLLASFPEENGSSTGFSQGTAPPFFSPQAAEAWCIWKAWSYEQRNMWKVSLPGVWHLKSASRIISAVFHSHRSPCTCCLTHDTLCQSLTLLKALGSPVLSPAQGGSSDTLHLSTISPIPKSRSAAQPSQLSHKHPSHALSSLVSSTIRGPLRTRGWGFKVGWVVDGFPVSSEVVFSRSFSFSEDLYRVLPADLHTTCKNLPFPSLQLLTRPDSSWVDARTHARAHGVQAPQIHFLRNPVWSQHLCSLAVPEAPASRWEGMEDNGAGSALTEAGRSVGLCGRERGEGRLGLREWVANLTVKNTLCPQSRSDTEMKWGERRRAGDNTKLLSWGAGGKDSRDQKKKYCARQSTLSKALF